jgi:UDP-N-acetylglucosamine 2-epimerase (non-hydrolysing)
MQTTQTSVFLVGGARPNFMKVAPLYHALRRSPAFEITLVHTGQHYDDRLAGSFFRDLGLPDPDISLNVGSGSHGAQTARVLERFEQELCKRQPDLVVVVGDVNSTIACALATVKMTYPDGRRPRVAHVEAGLRSFDRAMPEEINRILCDAISDFLFVTEESGTRHLEAEGVNPSRVFLVGNVMIDTLRQQSAAAEGLSMWTRLGLSERRYAVATLHRPSNVDDDAMLARLIGTLSQVAEFVPVVFPVHPRTRARLDSLALPVPERLRLCEPMAYPEFLSLMMKARLVLTDSGGIQEETTCLGVPCLTLRENTERPITVTQGTNRVIGTDPAVILREVRATMLRPLSSAMMPPLWDGQAAGRIVDVLERAFAPVDRADRKVRTSTPALEPSRLHAGL